MNYSKIIESFKLSEDYIILNIEKLDFFLLIVHQDLSEFILRKFSKTTDWIFSSKYQCLNEKLIEDFYDKVDWIYISRYQYLSENFITKYKHKINWEHLMLSKFQRNRIFSRKFLVENKEKLNFKIKNINQYLFLLRKINKIIFLQRNIIKYLYRPGKNMYLLTKKNYEKLSF